MVNTFAAQPGKAAILTYGSAYPFADPQFTDPVNHLGANKFNTAFKYLGVVRTFSGAIDLNVLNGGWSSVAAGYQKTILAHGLGYAPIIAGYIAINGINVPLHGDFLAPFVPGSPITFIHNVWADATNIYITAQQTRSVISTSIANNCGFVIYAMNIGRSAAGAVVLPSFYNGFYVSPTYFKAGYVDTSKYGMINQDVAGALRFYRGPSMSVQLGYYPSNHNYMIVGVAQNVNGYSNQNIGTQAVGSPFNYPGTSAAAAATVSASPSFPGSTIGLRITPGRIQLGTVLDTLKPSLQLPRVIQTSFTIPGFNFGTGGAVDQTSVFNLGSVPAGSTDVLGWLSVGGQTYSIGGNRILATEMLGMASNAGYVAGPGGSNPANLLGSIRHVYFQIAGGQLQAVARNLYPKYGSSGSRPAIACSVYALVGAFV